MRRMIPFLVLGLALAGSLSAHNSAGPVTETHRSGTVLSTPAPMPQAPNFIRGNDDTRTERRDVGAFSNISIEGPFNVEIDTQRDSAVRVIADSNLIPHIVTQVEGDTLRIYAPIGFETDDTLRVEINNPAIAQLAVSRDARVDVDSLNNARLTVHATDDSLVDLSGRTTALDVTLEKNAKLKASRLNAQDVVVRQTGSSHAEVYAARNLNLDVAESSKLFYYGKPDRIEQRQTGTATLHSR